MAGGKIIIGNNAAHLGMLSSGSISSCDSASKNVLDILTESILIDRISLNLVLRNNPHVPFDNRKYQVVIELPEPIHLNNNLYSFSFDYSAPRQDPSRIIVTAADDGYNVQIATKTKQGIYKVDWEYTPDHLTAEYYIEKKGVRGKWTYTLYLDLVGTYEIIKV